MEAQYVWLSMEVSLLSQEASNHVLPSFLPSQDIWEPFPFFFRISEELTTQSIKKEGDTSEELI